MALFGNSIDCLAVRINTLTVSKSKSFHALSTCVVIDSTELRIRIACIVPQVQQIFTSTTRTVRVESSAEVFQERLAFTVD